MAGWVQSVKTALCRLLIGALMVWPTASCQFDPGGVGASSQIDGGPDHGDASVHDDAHLSDGSLLVDAQSSDAAHTDSTLPDSTLPDSTLPDSTLPDSTLPDAAPPDAAIPDADGDGVADMDDNCVNTYNPNQLNSDPDGYGDECDNCPFVDNPNQNDQDGDDEGDACDPDIDGDGIPNEHDPRPTVADGLLFYSDNGYASTGQAEDDYSFGQGTWAASNGRVCQSDVNQIRGRSRIQSSLIPSTDYVAETEFEILDWVNHVSYRPWVGLLFRTSYVGTSFDGYVCVVDPRDDTLVLALYDSGNYVGQISETNFGSVPDVATHRLRIIADGSSITCAHLPNGPTITHTSSYHTGGTVGLYTHIVSACFDFLTVVDPW